MMFRFIRTLFIDFVDLLFPNLCLGCNQSLVPNEKILCAQCRINLPETEQHREPYNRALLNKFAGKVSIQFLASYLYFTKGGIVQKIIHGIKYKGHKDAAKEISAWYGHQLKAESPFFDQIDVIIGVPLHKTRFLQRGYNQADSIAEGIGEALHVPVRTDILVRRRFNESQTHKNRVERWENVKSVFSVADVEAIKEKHVVIVDDVLTTGATIEACANELLRAGCASVSVLTLAVADS